jgi:tyrosine-protein kinase Etk/Wzc
MRAFVTEENPNFRRVRQDLASLRGELSKLENGRPEATVPSGTQSGGITNNQELRGLKYQQMLYDLLQKQYESARLDEAKEPTVVQVLDRASEPERPVKPRRLIITLLGAVFGFGIGAALAICLEAKAKLIRRPGARERYEMLVSALSGRK